MYYDYKKSELYLFPIHYVDNVNECLNEVSIELKYFPLYIVASPTLLLLYFPMNSTNT